MSSFREINKNAFTEKILHRYFMESLYFGSLAVRNMMLPNDRRVICHLRHLNLILPELAKDTKGYRPDFTLFFRDKKKGIPVEIKWKSSEFTKKSQVDYIKKNSGYLFCLNDDSPEKTIPKVVIEPVHFRNWLSDRIDSLCKDALLEKELAPRDISESQVWLVPLRGTAFSNWKKMESLRSKDRFWAFSNSSFSVRHLLNAHRGDKIIFLFFEAPGSQQKMRLGSRNITVNRCVEGVLTHPYCNTLEGEKSEIFEGGVKGGTSLNNRKYVHFMKFEIERDPPIENVRTLLPSPLAEKIVEASNSNSSLTPITSQERDWLRSELRKSSRVES